MTIIGNTKFIGVHHLKKTIKSEKWLRISIEMISSNNLISKYSEEIDDANWVKQKEKKRRKDQKSSVPNTQTKKTN